jgi:hypothetical protein
MAEDKNSVMAEEKSSVTVFPPAYSGINKIHEKRSFKTKLLFGYAVAVSTALMVTLVLGGLYYYRSLDVIQESIQKFQVVDKSGGSPLSQNVELNAAQNTVVFRLIGQDITFGTFAVLDYTKSMTGVYDAGTRKCYLIGGIRSSISDLNTLSDEYAKNTTNIEASGETLNYVLADSYPVSDKSILPSPLQSACLSLPTYWLEPAPASTTITTSMPNGRRKRGFWGSIWKGIKWVVNHVSVVVTIPF